MAKCTNFLQPLVGLTNDVLHSCSFCGFDQPDVTVLADAQVRAFISLSPINRYHVLVVPKIHYEHLADVPQETLAAVMRVAQRISAAIHAVARPDAISLLSDDDLRTPVSIL